MTQINLCDTFGDGLGALFTCEPIGDYQRIRTPYLYPDGDEIDVFLKPSGQTITVTDLGETTGWLRMQTVSPKRSPRQRAMIDDACLTHGVEFYRGMLMARCRPGDDLAAVATRVAQAALRVSDLWFTFRARSFESVNDEVAEFLTEHAFDYVRNERLAGRSGRAWTVNFHVRTAQRSSLVQTMSTGNRSAAKAVASQVLAAWVDLSQHGQGVEGRQFISLVDDTSDVWSEADFNLVEPFSTVVRWSEPDRFIEVLRDAA